MQRAVERGDAVALWTTAMGHNAHAMLRLLGIEADAFHFVWCASPPLPLCDTTLSSEARLQRLRNEGRNFSKTKASSARF